MQRMINLTQTMPRYALLCHAVLVKLPKMRKSTWRLADAAMSTARSFAGGFGRSFAGQGPVARFHGRFPREAGAGRRVERRVVGVATRVVEVAMVTRVVDAVILLLPLPTHLRPSAQRGVHPEQLVHFVLKTKVGRHCLEETILSNLRDPRNT